MRKWRKSEGWGYSKSRMLKEAKDRWFGLGIRGKREEA
jgi:hypothetical protein